MSLRINVRDLADDVRASLERGEVVEIERDGEVVAQIHLRAPDETLADGDPWSRFIELRRAHGPVDTHFEEDLAEARRMLNGPVITEPWHPPASRPSGPRL